MIRSHNIRMVKLVWWRYSLVTKCWFVKLKKGYYSSDNAVPKRSCCLKQLSIGWQCPFLVHRAVQHTDDEPIEHISFIKKSEFKCYNVPFSAQKLDNCFNLLWVKQIASTLSPPSACAQSCVLFLSRLQVWGAYSFLIEHTVDSPPDLYWLCLLECAKKLPSRHCDIEFRIHLCVFCSAGHLFCLALTSNWAECAQKDLRPAYLNIAISPTVNRL